MEGEEFAMLGMAVILQPSEFSSKKKKKIQADEALGLILMFCFVCRVRDGKRMLFFSPFGLGKRKLSIFSSSGPQWAYRVFLFIPPFGFSVAHSRRIREIV